MDRKPDDAASHGDNIVLSEMIEQERIEFLQSNPNTPARAQVPITVVRHDSGINREHAVANAVVASASSAARLQTDGRLVGVSQAFRVFRAVIGGIFIGALLCFSNMYFGLQTGWVTMGSLPSTIVGFGMFKSGLMACCMDFSMHELVLLQTVAVATATMPLAAGFVGIIPALGMLSQAQDGVDPIHLSVSQLILWCVAIAFFGVFFAVPLRKQVIVKEQLAFPSGTATAEMIRVLHRQLKPTDLVEIGATHIEDHVAIEAEWKRKWRILFVSFFISSVATFLMFFICILRNIPLLAWLGVQGATSWSWTLTPSFSYIGQGMIMGDRACASTMLGAIIGWAVIGPMLVASSYVTTIQDGTQWVMWISLSIMVAESFSSLCILTFNEVQVAILRRFSRSNPDDGVFQSELTTPLNPNVDASVSQDLPPEFLVPHSWWLIGLTLSTALGVSILCDMFEGMTAFEAVVGFSMGLFVSVLAVRSLGETDLNPVSGVGKVAQILFAAIAPGKLVPNLIAGAVAEAGAQQAGDLMQTMKTGFLQQSSVRLQFFGQCIGTFVSLFLSIAAYSLYTNTYRVPGPILAAPTASLWLDMARLLNGQQLDHLLERLCIISAVIAGSLPVLARIQGGRYKLYFPSGVALAIGMFVTPNWSIARAIGGLSSLLWRRWDFVSHRNLMVVVASGFVLGEGLSAIVTAILHNVHAPVIGNC